MNEDADPRAQRRELRGREFHWRAIGMEGHLHRQRIGRRCQRITYCAVQRTAQQLLLGTGNAVRVGGQVLRARRQRQRG